MKPINMSRFTKFLNWVERVGNALPHPAFLFLIFTAFVVLLSSLFSKIGVQAMHPVKNTAITVVDLLSIQGLHLVLVDMVKNFSSFAPLGTVLVAMLGFSLAEKSGLLSTLLRLLVIKAPEKLIIPSILLAGVLSHTASDVGYVILIPLAAMLFHNMGRHPLAGLTIAFAGVSGGFAANFLLSSADTVLSALSQEAARIIDPKVVVTPLANWYFMATSSVAVTAIGTWIGTRVTVPYLGEFKGKASNEKIEKITALEKRGLRWAAIATLVLTALLVLGLVPENGFLRDPKADIFHSPALKGVVAIIFFFGAVTGLAYGFGAKTMKNQNDIVQAMQSSMETMAPYLVLVFFAAQFVALFNASNLGIVCAIHGSALLKQTGLGPIPLMISFVLLTCLLDFVVSSASAKWALMAPIFVPMFMLLGYSPELTQTSYRIGDSVINIVSPMMSYFPLILAFANKYDPKAKLGTLVALMLPYSLGFLAFWLVMLGIWILLGLPLGPGAGLFYSMPGL